MGGMKNQGCMDPQTVKKKKRLYQVWKGRNKFFCGGRLIFGPEIRSVFLSALLIGGPALTFCAKIYSNISRVGSFYERLVVTVGVVLTFLALTFLFIISTTNPGIIPRCSRAFPDRKSLDSFPSIDWLGDAATPRFNIPRVKDVIVNGIPVKVKYCESCLLYRPPRASHCSICNNCIQRFDHHCPWLNQCIGARNYRTFILFITTSTILCLYVFMLTVVTLYKETSSAHMMWSGDAVMVFLMVYCFVTSWFLGGLTFFHYYLIFTNQTTYENFRCVYGKKENPHNRGTIKNLKEILFSKTTPSLVNFREWVNEEDGTSAESVNRRFGWDSVKTNKTMDLELSIHSKDDESLKKGRGGKTENDPFMFPIYLDDMIGAGDRASVDDKGGKESSNRTSMAEPQR